MKKVWVCFTCFNRREMSLRCMRTLHDSDISLKFFVVDDGSTDGTPEAIKEYVQKEKISYKLIHGDGNLFWAGGMRVGMKEMLKELRDKKEEVPEYIALVNDDVEFVPGALSRMIERSLKKGGMPVTGATSGKTADGIISTSYGGVRYDRRHVRPEPVRLEDANVRSCDTMNCNCLLLPTEAFMKAGAFDPHYKHSMADYDYGFELRRLGYEIWLTDFYVGSCDDNPVRGSWRDTALSRIERLKKKESPKGLPLKTWFYFVRKNFGLRQAIWHSITPYLRIILGK